MTVELSGEAEADLTGILVYTLNEFGPTQLEKYFKVIKEGLHYISKFPNSGHIRRDIPYSLVAYPVGEHLVIYKVADKTSILVIRILHSRMDFSNKT